MSSLGYDYCISGTQWDCTQIAVKLKTNRCVWHVHRLLIAIACLVCQRINSVARSTVGCNSFSSLCHLDGSPSLFPKKNNNTEAGHFFIIFCKRSWTISQLSLSTCTWAVLSKLRIIPSRNAPFLKRCSVFFFFW